MVTIREEIIELLHAVERLRSERVSVVHVIVDERGKEIGRVVRGRFIASPGSHVGEPQQGDRS
jgi:hypothetical protein